MLANIRVAFKCMDVDMFKKLYVGFVRPKLEYAGQVWNPHQKNHIMKIEKVQRHATKWVPELRGLGYEERLRRLGLTTLEERRMRGDMITTYKYVKGIDKMDRGEFLRVSKRESRGHRYRLLKKRSMNDGRKFFFVNRVVESWNGLGKEVVEAHTVSAFKAKYDKEIERV